MREIQKNCKPKDFEEKIYKKWQQEKVFTPVSSSSTQDPFVIIMPPPNVTGVLHMGHGLNMSLQDILVRYQRLKGREVLWIPGTDHAGIATQSIVEKKLKEKGISRKDLGREKFLEQVWQVKEEHQKSIRSQFKKLGLCVDWSRESFTLD